MLSTIQLIESEKGRWILQNQQGANFKLNNETVILVNILQNTNSYQDAQSEFNIQFDKSLSLTDFKKLVNDVLGGYKILENDESNKVREPQKSYLTFKIPLIPANVAYYLSKPFQILFNPHIFYTTLLINIVFLASFFFVNHLPNNIKIGNSYWLIFSLLALNMFLHELGHITSITKHGVINGEIGFGVYWIFPVVYANISNVWLLDKQKRIIANLGGIYMEVMFSSICLVIYIIFQSDIFFLVAFLVFTNVIWELSPFIRRDGYWLLSDLTNTPNLLQRSLSVWREHRDKIKTNKLSLENCLLIVYMILNYSIIYVLSTLILVRNFEGVIAFPLEVVNGCILIFQGEFERLLIFKSDFFIITLFYIILFRIVYQLIRASSNSCK